MMPSSTSIAPSIVAPPILPATSEVQRKEIQGSFIQASELPPGYPETFLNPNAAVYLAKYVSLTDSSTQEYDPPPAYQSEGTAEWATQEYDVPHVGFINQSTSECQQSKGNLYFLQRRANAVNGLINRLPLQKAEYDYFQESIQSFNKLINAVQEHIMNPSFSSLGQLQESIKESGDKVSTHGKLTHLNQINHYLEASILAGVGVAFLLLGLLPSVLACIGSMLLAALSSMLVMNMIEEAPKWIVHEQLFELGRQALKVAHAIEENNEGPLDRTVESKTIANAASNDQKNICLIEKA